MAELLKRIVVAQRPAVLIEDLNVFLRNNGESLNLLALDVKGRPIRSLERVCASVALDILIKNGSLKLYDENGTELTGTLIERSTNLATLNDSGEGTSLGTRTIQETLSVDSPGQTAFVLTNTPLYDDGVIMFVNGNKQTITEKFTVSGKNIT